jgi:hypothetical protein
MSVVVLLGCNLLWGVVYGITQEIINREVYELVSDQATDAEPPSPITISIDGDKATFMRGTASYQQLVNLLRHGRSDKIVTQAGGYPNFSNGDQVCGRLIIPNFGIPFHFSLMRSKDNPNFYWIFMPKPNGLGSSIQLFMADPRFTQLVHTQAAATP